MRERGYRVCLDGLTHLTAPFIDRERLGLDLIKVYWSQEMLYDPSGLRREAFREMIGQSGPTRVILCRCGNEEAIEYGRALGISLFQGNAVDARLAAEERKGAANITVKQAHALGAERIRR